MDFQFQKPTTSNAQDLASHSKQAKPKDKFARLSWQVFLRTQYAAKPRCYRFVLRCITTI
jgi:hypothetical protein